MQCYRCHSENAADSAFCHACGSGLLACPACGASLPPESRFCSKCGAPVAAPAVPANVDARPAPSVSSHAAERVPASRGRLEGERKQVSVLFADMKGSMELLAERDPEEARAVLDPVLELMMEAVHRYEGTVNQVLGDGIMALFGAPVAHEDHAVRACYAALAMQSAVQRHNAQTRDGLDAVRIRVGINSGEVVVRAIGSDLHMDYTAIGQATHLAARMEQLANPDTILLTADTHRFADGFIRTRSLGPHTVKGLAHPIEVYELTGVAPALTRWQATVARGLGRFVGRDAELAVLNLGLENARAGRGQVVALVGEPGVGKSRLLWELTHSSRTSGWLVLESGSAPFGRTSDYRPITALLRAYFQIEPLDDTRKIREKVAGKVAGFAPEAQPALLSLLDAGGDDAEWRALDPPDRRQRVLAAVAAVLVHESRLQPVCVVFEDLHWADPETLAVLDRLVAALPGERMLLLISYRPGFEHAWRHRAPYTEVPLQGLPPAGSEALLGAMLGHDASLGPLTRLLIERTDGNPLFIEETVRTLVETGTLVGEPGAFSLARPVDTIQVPPTVQVVLAARVDRLPPEEKRLLQIAAVIGREVPYALAREVARLPEDGLRRALAHLQEAGFLYEAKIFPALEYTFKHALTHEVAYQSLLHERRRTLHAAIVEALERLHGTHPADQIDQLAHHAVQGELWEKAVAYCRQAGARAFARSVPRTAVSRFEEALRALERLPQTRETLEQALDLRLDLRYALMPLGEFARIVHELGVAEDLARQLGDERRLGIVSAFLSNHYTILSDLARGAEYGEQVLGIAMSLDDLPLRVLANSALAIVHYRIGHYERASALARTNIGTLQGELQHERFGMAPIASVYARTLLAWSLAEVGDFDDGMAAAREAIRIAEGADHPHSICFACHGLGMIHWRRGEHDASIAVFERARMLCETADLAILYPVVAGPLASALAAAGDGDKALALLDDGVRRAQALGHPFGHWLRTGALGEALFYGGRIEEALPLARLGVDVTRFVKARGGEAWALWILAETLTAHPDRDVARDAHACYRDVLTMTTELRMRPLEARCSAGLARLHRREGDHAAAERSVETARNLYRAMGMRYWLEKLDREA